MTFRLVQKGRAPAVIGWLVGQHMDAELRAALPGHAIVMSSEAPPIVPLTRIDAARGMVGLDGAPYALLGYSAGCQAVRSLLRAGAEPSAVVTIDGTHSSQPPLAWQIDVWSALAEQARAGELLWVATFLAAHRYVERLQHGAYSSTATTLALALEMPELAAFRPLAKPLASYPGPAVAEVHEGNLHVLGYASLEIDEDAHKAQQRLVLPAMLREHVAPWLEQLDGEPTPVTDRSPPRTLSPARFALDPGLAVLSIAQQDLNAGIRERGHNAGPDIEGLYLKPLGLAPGSNYCAAAVASWIRRAERAYGIKLPIVGSAGAKATRDQFVKAGLWTPVSRLTRDDFRPGAVPVWDRSLRGPGESGFEGHIGIVVDHGESQFWSIEANALRERETDDVRMVTHEMFGDPDLLGVGHFSRLPTPNSVPHDVA